MPLAQAIPPSIASIDFKWAFVNCHYSRTLCPSASLWVIKTSNRRIKESMVQNLQSSTKISAGTTHRHRPSYINTTAKRKVNFYLALAMGHYCMSAIWLIYSIEASAVNESRRNLSWPEGIGPSASVLLLPLVIFNTALAGHLAIKALLGLSIKKCFF